MVLYTVTDQSGMFQTKTFKTLQMAKHHATLCNQSDGTHYRMYYGWDRFRVTEVAA